ncbi:MAG: hypothetical protein K2Y71_27020 [Xanthobacteraceae bacterium]|nr:hypothetical protein [Xanthobacteraceae bacterium]
MSKTIMTKTLRRIGVASLLASLAASADAAPNIPSSELPGRARQQFQESPIDRFTQPSQKTQPLWQWECDRPKAKGRKHSRSTSRRC